MTSWGQWTCPICGNEWRGSIGYYNILTHTDKEFQELLEAICGCTKKKILKEIQTEMIVFTRMAGTKDKLDD